MSELDIMSVVPPEVTNAFASAAMTTLLELTQVEITDEPRLAVGEMPHTSISAEMQLVRTHPGIMALVLPIAAAERLAKSYLPEGTLLTDDMVDDVVGEFANVIAGQAKTILKGTPYHFALSIPVVSRVPFNRERLPNIRALVVPFEEFESWLFIDLLPCPGA